jgi:hypothetical protein
VSGPVIVFETWDGCTREQAEDLIANGRFLDEDAEKGWMYFVYKGNMVKVKTRAEAKDE